MRVYVPLCRNTQYCRATLASLRGRTGAEMDDVEGVERHVLEETGIQSRQLLERKSERQPQGDAGQVIRTIRL